MTSEGLCVKGRVRDKGTSLSIQAEDPRVVPREGGQTGRNWYNILKGRADPRGPSCLPMCVFGRELQFKVLYFTVGPIVWELWLNETFGPNQNKTHETIPMSLTCVSYGINEIVPLCLHIAIRLHRSTISLIT